MQSRAHQSNVEDEVVRLVRDGRIREAVGQCAREHGAPLGRFCMALLGSQADAEEAAQETLVAAFAALPAFRGECSVRGFLYGIARNVCARKLAMRTRRDRRIALVHDADAHVPSPAELTELRAEAHRLRVALEALRPTDRESLLLRYEAGLSHGEAAMALGIDEATARKRAGRALARLRQAFETEGGR